MNDQPLIIQSDRTVVVEVYHPRYAEVRDRLAGFAELEKSPEHLHTYRISAISVWNAAALGVPESEISRFLTENSRYAVPTSLLREVREWYHRFGLLRLLAGEGGLVLEARDAQVLDDVLATRTVSDLIRARTGPQTALVAPEHRGVVKQALIRLGFPVQDLAGYLPGAPLAIGLRERTRSGRRFDLRGYQAESADILHAQGRVEGGSGVVVLPCGAGKTVVGLAVMNRVGTYTLVLTTNGVAVRQWRDEILDKTDLSPEQVGEYTGEAKDIRPVTITTYQMLTYRRRKGDEFEHFGLFSSREWGLVVYDEVHLLPAPVFRVTADIQARRRLGLTATLVREDGKEDEVFCLIGPKRYDVPWKVLERQGYIASAICTEVRVPLPDEMRPLYMSSDARAKFRIASENPRKLSTVRDLLVRHHGDHILVIGQYLDQLHQLCAVTGAPLITGKTPQGERRRLYEAFKRGSVPVLLVSKVGNFAIDLPDANVAIQVSGTFGSRQEEAQRLGRILRPKDDGRAAHFYSLVTAETREQEFAEKRQRFLTEQGYAYEIADAERYRQIEPGSSATSA
jgi:DNA excision repair protein ERCC-3